MLMFQMTKMKRDGHGIDILSLFDIKALFIKQMIKALFIRHKKNNKRHCL